MRVVQGTIGMLALAAAFGCAPGSPGEPAVAAAPGPATQTRHGPAHTEADVEFMRHMIHHHAQALEMVALVEGRSENEILPLLAERIEVSQRDEIARMEQWLRTRGLEVPTTGGQGAHHDPAHAAMHARHHGEGGEMVMPGMLTPEEMAELRAATGAAFDRLFLEFMIRHHEGALVMVEELFAQPGAGQEPEIYQFAAEVVADQQMEIDRMRTLLDRLSSRPSARLPRGTAGGINLQHDTP